VRRGVGPSGEGVPEDDLPPSPFQVIFIFILFLFYSRVPSAGTIVSPPLGIFFPFIILFFVLSERVLAEQCISLSVN
jgi:hypothetical protein